ncbi:Calsyntenin-1 like [Actinidia chinensis var. chinensis]|uniref:Calsyntenin-1 like n=1 Tax=Actinidia chinensis var. chinensis TaxID=1590841 RepID=A0A2R6PQQ1_ACTCC|nr:Calsyntenin-1 like [Actinidia chinensis var. chinensis]
MLSASNWFKQLSQRKPDSYISNTQCKACLNCQICRPIREPEKGNRTLWVNKFVDVCLVTSSHALRTRRHHLHVLVKAMTLVLCLKFSRICWCWVNPEVQ